MTGMDLTPCSGMSDNPCNEEEKKNCSKTHAGTRDGSDLTGIQEVNPTFPYSQVNRWQSLVDRALQKQEQS